MILKFILFYQAKELDLHLKSTFIHLYLRIWKCCQGGVSALGKVTETVNKESL